MNKLKTKKQVEAVVWLHNLTEKDELYLIHVELHYSLAAAKIKNFPHKYERKGSNAIMQYYIPTTRWDKDFIELIISNELGDKFMKMVASIKE